MSARDVILAALQANATDTDPSVDADDILVALTSAGYSIVPLAEASKLASAEALLAEWKGDKGVWSPDSRYTLDCCIRELAKVLGS